MTKIFEGSRTLLFSVFSRTRIERWNHTAMATSTCGSEPGEKARRCVGAMFTSHPLYQGEHLIENLIEVEQEYQAKRSLSASIQST